MHTLYIFNPEHDLALANGNSHYVPPSAALQFALSCKQCMATLYNVDSNVIASVEIDDWFSVHHANEVDTVIPWGWNPLLKWQLQRIGMAEESLPSNDYLNCLRHLQHRTTWTALQPHAFVVKSVEEVSDLLTSNWRLVLKAPWSGSGRGLRWVDKELSKHDCLWINRIVEKQGAVIAERRVDVEYDCAIEYMIESHKVTQIGFSLFDTQSGVYRANHLLYDEEIRRLVDIPLNLEKLLLRWISDNIALHYKGPLGVDLIRTTDGEVLISEFNLRHSMGMVAHSFLIQHPECHHSIWHPNQQ